MALINLIEKSGKKYEVGISFLDDSHQYYGNVVSIYRSTINTDTGVKEAYNIEESDGKVYSVISDMVERIDFTEKTWGGK